MGNRNSRWMALGLGVGGGGVPLPEVEFLLRDDFLTDENPLASPRAAEPGPGTLIDIAGDSYIENQQLRARNFRYDNAFQRRPGLAIVTNSQLNGGRGWDNDTASSLSRGGMALSDNGTYIESSTNGIFSAAMSGWRRSAHILRSDGSHFLVVRDDATYTDWTLIFVTWPITDTGNIYPGIYLAGTGDQPATDTFRVLDMGDVWQDDFGIATQRLSGAQSAGTTFAHEPDCNIEWIQTALPSSDYTDVYFRYLDDDNCLVLSVASDGALELHEVESGNWSLLGSSLSGAVANGYRVAVLAHEDDLRVVSEDADGTNDVRFVTSDSGALAAATGGKIAELGPDGAVSDLITWPRRMRGIAKQWLDAAIAD